MSVTISPTEILTKSIQASREARLNINNNNIIPQFPCNVCNYNVSHNDKSVLCTSCGLWGHIKCNHITIEEYRERQIRNRDFPNLIENELWNCLSCELKNKAEYTPLIHLDSHQLHNLNAYDTMKIIDLLPDNLLSLNAMNTNHISINRELDENDLDYINSKYYRC